jgi:hypothetical protein
MGSCESTENKKTTNGLYSKDYIKEISQPYKSKSGVTKFKRDPKVIYGNGLK